MPPNGARRQLLAAIAPRIHRPVHEMFRSLFDVSANPYNTLISSFTELKYQADIKCQFQLGGLCVAARRPNLNHETSVADIESWRALVDAIGEKHQDPSILHDAVMCIRDRAISLTKAAAAPASDRTAQQINGISIACDLDRYGPPRVKFR